MSEKIPAGSTMYMPSVPTFAKNEPAAFTLCPKCFAVVLQERLRSHGLISHNDNLGIKTPHPSEMERQ